MSRFRIWLRPRKALPDHQLKPKSRRGFAHLRLEALEERAMPDGTAGLALQSNVDHGSDALVRIMAAANYRPTASTPTSAQISQVAAGLDALALDIIAGDSVPAQPILSIGGGAPGGSGGTTHLPPFIVDNVNESAWTWTDAAPVTSSVSALTIDSPSVDAALRIQVDIGPRPGPADVVDSPPNSPALASAADMPALEARSFAGSAGQPQAMPVVVAQETWEASAGSNRTATITSEVIAADAFRFSIGIDAQLARATERIHGDAHAGNGVGHADEMSDGMLLQQYVAHGKQTAFALLVQRHRSFVLSICQRVLGDSHIAEDAVQATFLVLARKASMLDGRNPLTGWLYKVAYHLALRFRSVSARRQRWERDGSKHAPCACRIEPDADLEQQELRHVLYAELRRLPDKLRVPLTLCYLEGRTHEEAALEIGMPRGSMAKRIAQGLEILRERLIERGFIF